MAVNWNALQTPNFAAAYGQGVEFKNALEDRQYQRQRDVMQDERQARQDQRQDRRDTLEEQQFARQTKLDSVKAAREAITDLAPFLRDVKGPEDLARLNSDPFFRSIYDGYKEIVPEWEPFETQTLEDVQGLVGTAERLDPTAAKWVEWAPGVKALVDERGNVLKEKRVPFTVGDYYMDPEAEGGPTVSTGGDPVPPPPAPPEGAQPETVSYRNAIASIESQGSGDYKAMGPVTRTGDRAYGRYQVMGANIGPWTRQALGREMTPQEFLANPQAQDAVFDHIFGGYVQQYGSPEEAASMWFTGRPLAEGANRRDVNGMTGSRYVAKFTAARGGGQEALAGGDGGDTLSDAPSVPGFTPRRVKPAEQTDYWDDLPGGGQRNRRTNETRGVPSPQSKAPTDGDKQSVAFAYRTIRANDRLNAVIESGIVKPTTVTTSLFNADKSGARRLILRTPEDRRFFQAAKEWLAPVLRKDTGAAVTDEELATYMDIYIPRYEDSPEVLRQKAEARQDAMIALVRQGGSLYDRTYGAREFQSQWGPVRRRPQSQPKPKGRTSGNGWKVLGVE